MARNRMIKPEFWSSEQVMYCSRDARLLFIGMLNFADDGGVFRNSPKMLKAQIFPADEDVYINCVEKMISELILNKLIMQFESDGEQFFYIIKWDVHQKIDKPTFKFKKPSIDLIEDFLNPKKIRLAFDEGSDSSQLALDTKIKENKRNENKLIGNENNYFVEQARPDKKKTRTKNSQSDGKGAELLEAKNETLQVFEYWKMKFQKNNRCVLDKKRKAAIDRALKSFSVQEIKQAVDGCLGDKDWMTKGFNHDIEFICRNAPNTEMFIGYFHNPRRTPEEIEMQKVMDLNMEDYKSIW